MLWFESIDNLNDAQELVRRRRYGVIEIESGEFRRLSFRPWPKLISRIEIETLGRWKHAAAGDRCRLFYNFPFSAPGFLSLAYVESTRQTSWKTLRRSLEVLDWIAQIRRANANVCELSNEKISQRAMERVGWEVHCEHLSGRHFIKRFYGEYPQHAWLPEVIDPYAELLDRLTQEGLSSHPLHANVEIDLVDDRVGC
ncbi:hypothetical protein ACYFX5_07525 [Bremerella sp. T1]|uniref:hypothetical protein n=1 Tax=Bremerella sp. TYQ1 TaxID=3119568 RepID=UPI001CCA8F9F|nr:hypothetical protein [Bremerella volcania]UBM38106.1 hypothetical protein LA756_09460 [Bremerella volcania]